MKIRTHKSFDKKFLKLNSKLKKKFKEKRDIFIKNPFDPVLNNHPLSGDRSGQRSIDIKRDLMVIYECQEDIIIFLDIDNHNNLYK